MSKEIEDMMANVLASNEATVAASIKETEAKFIAAQASNEAAIQSKRVADTNVELINSVKDSIRVTSKMLDSLSLMEQIALQISKLIEINYLSVTILANREDTKETRQLQNMMHELAMKVAGKGVSVNSGLNTEFSGNVKADKGSSIINKGNIENE